MTASGRTLSRLARGQAGDTWLLSACERWSQDGWPDVEPRRVLRRLPLGLLWFLKRRRLSLLLQEGRFSPRFRLICRVLPGVCSDRILTCRIKSIRSPAKVGLVVTDLITSPVVSWEGWETPPPPSTEAQLSFFAQPPAWEDLSAPVVTC